MKTRQRKAPTNQKQKKVLRVQKKAQTKQIKKVKKNKSYLLVSSFLADGPKIKAFLKSADVRADLIRRPISPNP